jgi:hypothetical protein
MAGGVGRHHLGQPTLHLGPPARGQPAHLVVDADDLAVTVRLSLLVADPELALQRRFPDPVVDGAGRRRHLVHGPPIKCPPLPVVAAHPVQHLVVGVDLGVAVAAHPMVDLSPTRFSPVLTGFARVRGTGVEGVAPSDGWCRG